MRETKYRAWDKDKNEMIFWEELRKTYASFLNTPNDWLYDCMQYTGLKDKNGVEIYEGDILTIYFGDPSIHGKFTHSNVEVFWSEKRLQFCVRRGNISEQEITLVGYYLGEYEVIGNIYENPELLK